MRTKKKLIAILLIATILSSLLPNLLSFAESNGQSPDFQLNISGTTENTKEVQIGEEVSVDLKLNNGKENQIGLAIIVQYDSSKLEAISDGKDLNSGELTWNKSISFDIPTEDGIKRGYSASLEGDMKGIIIAFYSDSNFLNTTGDIAKLKFKVIEAGNTEITYRSITYTDLNGDEIPCTTTNSVKLYVPVPMADFTVSPTATTVNKGLTTTLKAEKYPTDTTDTTPVTWKSSDTSVATVDSNGKVTAVDVGTATITATCGTYSDTSVITVDNPLQELKLDKTAETISRGDFVQLTAIKNPTDTTDTTPVTWASSNEAVATVDSNGKVTAVGIGTATITATCGAHTTKQPFNITVNAPLVGIEIDKKEAGIDKEETVDLKVIKNPVDTTDLENVVWTSSNEAVATVDQNGKVTGKSLGKTTITATITTPYRTCQATCEVTVNVHIEDIKIVNHGIVVNNETNKKELELYKNQIADLTIDFTPDEFAETKTIIWDSSDKTVAKVENGKVTAVSPGKATITATTVNGKTDDIEVIVPVVKAETLTINKNNTSIEKGYSEKLTATVLPENTTDDTTVTWESSDENVVTVDNEGNVTAVGVGNAKVIAKVSGLENAECNVTVTCTLKGISLDKNELKLEAGASSEALVVTKNPTDATVDLADVKWTSKNTSVATVVDGVVTAVAPGTAIIEAELDGKTAPCEVTVIVTLTGVEIENENEDLELIKGQTSDLKVVYTPANATEIPTATWDSSDEAVATVDENGKITALKEGTTTITVDYGSGITATRIVNVKEIPADSVVIDKVIESLNKNETVDLTATMTPANTTDEIKWSSSDETIAKIDNNGKLTALKAGKVTITATATNGKSAEMEIEVKEVSLKSIIVSADEKVEEGKTTQVKVKLNPEDTTDDLTYTYKSSNTSIAAVDKNGKVTAKKAGDVIITVSVEAKNGEGEVETITSQVKLTVTEKPATSTGSESAPAASASSPVAGLTTSPHTGDMNIVALAVMMVISLAGMIITVKKK